MPTYQELLNDLTKLREDVAVFRPVALHVHSPDSYDWKDKPDKTSKSLPSFSETEQHFINGISSGKVDLIAVTDHMKCGFACKLAASKAIRDTVVLPGMEINLRPKPPWNSFRLHVIAIFPENFSIEKVAKILPQELPDEKQRKGNEEIPNVHIEDFIVKVHNNGGLCIAAHINTDRGVRRTFRQIGQDVIVHYNPNVKLTTEEERSLSENFKKWILPAGFDAIEVGKEKDRDHYRWISDSQGTEISVPVLLSNDGHSVKDILNPERLTYVKMTTLGFEGLKEALNFPDTRIRFPADLPEPPSPRILGLHVISANNRAFFKDMKVAFSDNLTCLIGPRGSGKSTILETLRYVFGYNKTLDEIEEGSDIPKRVRSLQKATLCDCVIRVVYVGRDNKPRILESTYDEHTDYSTRVYDLNGDDQKIQDVESSGEFPLRLFGWSEIETLGRAAHRQRELLDRLVPGLQEKLRRRKELRMEMQQKIGEAKNGITRLKRIYDSNNAEIKRYNQYKKEFESLDTPEVRKLYAELDYFRNQERILEKARANAYLWMQNIEKNGAGELLDGIPELFVTWDPNLNKWWLEKKKSLSIANTQIEVAKSIEKAKKVLQGYIEKIDSEIAICQSEQKGREKDIRDRVIGETQEQVIADQREQARQRLTQVEDLKRRYDEELKILCRHLEQWDALMRLLLQVHNEITGIRANWRSEIEHKLNQFQEMMVSIKFSPSGDKKNFEDFLRDGNFFSRDLHGNYKQQQWPERIAQLLSPLDLCQAILSKEPDNLVKSATTESNRVEIDNSMAKRIVDTLYPFDADNDAEVEVVDIQKLEKVLSVAIQEWDDYECIMLNNLPVENLSPGQRSSAMLPLIALVEESPLIIDQPEDNLDNRMVGKTLTDILTGLKEKRQIIVATHNANIVVSGDAEQVIVLDAVSDSEGKCVCHGSVDKPEIVKSVVDIMEGGREAFEARRKRYGIQ